MRLRGLDFAVRVEGDPGAEPVVLLHGFPQHSGSWDRTWPELAGAGYRTVLLDLAERFGRPVENGVMVSHDLTQEELAQLVGASRETVNKALADFAGRGWLKLEARAVLLLDVDRLRRRAR